MPPFVAADGSIVVTDSLHFLVVDGQEFKVRNQTDLKSPSERPDILLPAYGDDGTSYFVTSDGRHIRGLHDRKEVLNLPVDAITTNIALSGNGLVYGTNDGQIRMIGQDGVIHKEYQLPMASAQERYRKDRPVAVQVLKGGSLIVQTADRRVLCIGPGGNDWSSGAQLKSDTLKSQPAVESMDGTVLYMAKDGGVAALDALTGKEKWSTDLKGSPAHAPSWIRKEPSISIQIKGLSRFFLLMALFPVHGARALIMDRATAPATALQSTAPEIYAWCRMHRNSMCMEKTGDPC